MTEAVVDIQALGVDLVVSTAEQVVVTCGERGEKGRDGIGAGAIPSWYRIPAVANTLSYTLPSIPQALLVEVNGVGYPVTWSGVVATLGGIDAGDVASTDELAFLIWS